MAEWPAPRDGEHQRLDTALVQAGLARSRGEARDLVAVGAVRVDGVPARRISQRVRGGQVVVADAPGWVSRGAGKLAAAFDRWQHLGLSAQGRRCLDIGASTGGFTQVLLVHGADEVVALDVGTAQLAPAIAADPKVREVSGVNIRDVDAEYAAGIGAPFDLVVADLSFISLTLVLPNLQPLMAPGAHGVLLVKPQFEVGRQRLGNSGVVRDRGTRLSALLAVLDSAAQHGVTVRDMALSPLRGVGGNQEYLFWVRSGATGPSPEQLRSRAEAVVGEEDTS